MSSLRSSQGLSGKVKSRLAKEGATPPARTAAPAKQPPQAEPSTAAAASSQPMQHLPPAPPNAGALPAADPKQPPSRLDRQYSMASQTTVTTLQQYELEIIDLKRSSEEAEAILQNPPPEGLLPQMRNQLAQLHGNANKLLATKLDAILTGKAIYGATALAREL